VRWTAADARYEIAQQPERPGLDLLLGKVLQSSTARCSPRRSAWGTEASWAVTSPMRARRCIAKWLISLPSRMDRGRRPPRSAHDHVETGLFRRRSGPTPHDLTARHLERHLLDHGARAVCFLVRDPRWSSSSPVRRYGRLVLRLVPEVWRGFGSAAFSHDVRARALRVRPRTPRRSTSPESARPGVVGDESPRM